jgi:hypothetical protein
VPAALALPVEAPPADGVLQLLAQAPKLTQDLQTPRCEDLLECAEAWRKALPGLQSAMQSQPEFGEACEAATARQPLRSVEALPERWSPEVSLPSYTQLTHCMRWAWSRAMIATEVGDLDATILALRQGEHLARSLLQGSRLLIGQMVAQRTLGHQLQLLVVIGKRRPEWRGNLLQFSELDGAALVAGTRRWIPSEAAFGRGAADSVGLSVELDPALQPRGATFWRFAETGWQPEYAKQLMNSHWARVLEAAQGDDPEAVLARVQVLLQPEPGWFGTGFRWFHTVPRIIHDVALPGYINYFQRPADLQLVAQTTHLWLRGGRPEQAQGPLRERLRQESNGSWRLRLHTAGINPGMPTRWPASN